VVFGKSAATQKTSPTSPQNSSPQKNANNGGANVQQGQVYICLVLLLCRKELREINELILS